MIAPQRPATQDARRTTWRRAPLAWVGIHADQRLSWPEPRRDDADMSWFLQQLTLPSGRRKRLDGQGLEDSAITQTAQVMQAAVEDAPFDLAHHDVMVRVAPEATRSLHNAVWRVSLPQRPTSALVAVAMRSRQGDRLWRWLLETLDDELLGHADTSDRPRAPWLVIVPHAPDDSENGPARIPRLESLAQQIAWTWATRIYKQASH